MKEGCLTIKCLDSLFFMLLLSLLILINGSHIKNTLTKPICATAVADIGNGRFPLWNQRIPKSESAVALSGNR